MKGIVIVGAAGVTALAVSQGWVVRAAVSLVSFLP